MLVEAVFAIFAGGFIGAVSQQLRRAQPLWATALLVWVGLPGLLILAQMAVHRMAGTPRLSSGLVASFCLAAVASSFSWYAMRQGAMLGGVDQTTVVHDLTSLPGITVDFVSVVPRLLARKFANGEKKT
jgi:predicted permease